MPATAQLTNNLTVTSATSGNEVELGLAAQTLTLGGKNYSRSAMDAPNNVLAAIPLGNLGSIGVFAIKNNDPTTIVELWSAAANGFAMQDIQPGSCIQGYFHNTITAPAVKGISAIANIEYLLAER